MLPSLGCRVAVRIGGVGQDLLWRDHSFLHGMTVVRPLLVAATPLSVCCGRHSWIPHFLTRALPYASS